MTKQNTKQNKPPQVVALSGIPSPAPTVQALPRLNFSPEGQAALIAEGKKTMPRLTPGLPPIYTLNDGQLSMIPDAKPTAPTPVDDTASRPPINPGQAPIRTCCDCFGLSDLLVAIKTAHYEPLRLAILCTPCFKKYSKTVASVVTSV